MLRIILACLVATAAMLASFGAVAQTEPLRVTISPGQSPQDAVRDSILAQRVAKLRTNWAASHPGAAAPTYTLPVMTAGKIITTSLNVTAPVAAPEVSVSFKTDKPGISYIGYEFVSPNGGQFVQGVYSYPGPLLTKGTLVMQGGSYSLLAMGASLLTEYAQPGNWSLENVELCDTAGDCNVYFGAALAKIFVKTTFLVINSGTPVTKPPEFYSGEILTPTVHLSAPNPMFSAQVGVRDDISGAEYAFVCIAPPGSNVGTCDPDLLPAPVFDGIALSNHGINASGPVGTWTVTGYGAYDVAGNYFWDGNAADVKKLFGTNSFKVAK